MRRHVQSISAFSIAILFAIGAGCGNVDEPDDDDDDVVVFDAGPESDAPPLIDAAPPPIDAAPPPIDAAIPPAPAKRANEITSASGRVFGGGVTIDVQIGHWFTQAPASGGGNTVEGAATVK